MAELLFVIAFVLPPAVVALGAGVLATGAMADHRESPALLREHHA